jgi:hypothetical protein
VSRALARLHELLADEGELLAQSRVADPGDETPLGRIAAAGPRAAAAPAEYELVVETIREGYLLHYGSPRVVAIEDPDLALLGGDHLYALGLARLVALGDVAAVVELADVIVLSALAHQRGEATLAPLIWEAGVRAVAGGASREHERAKDLVRAGDPAAREALADVAALPGRVLK